MATRVRAVARLLWRGVLVLVAAAAAVEGLLHLAAYFAPQRDGGDRDAARRIVCVGDSHTYGVLVPAEESYPAQLQRVLDEEAPGAFAVVNLGVPGFNSGLVRERLRTALGRYRPEVVVVWCGVNNTWNTAGAAATGSPRERLEAWMTGHVRLYRLWRTWGHDRAIHAELTRAGRPPRVVERRNADGTVASVTLDEAGRPGPITYERGSTAGPAAVEERLLADYRGMIADANAAGARIVFITYPFEGDTARVPNRALRRVFRETGVPVVDAGQALERLPTAARTFLWGGHPNGAVYGEIARDVAAALSGGAGAAGEPGLLARLDFAAGAVPRDVMVTGSCPTSETRCSIGQPCYRWQARSGRCHVEADLALSSPSVRVTARLRLPEAPPEGDPPRPFEILGIFEPSFASGLFLELVPPDRIRLLGIGKGETSCGPLAQPLTRGVTYEVEILAEKAGRSSASLELHDVTRRRLDAVRCSNVDAGGGRFQRLRVGSSNPDAAGTVEFDRVDVRGEAEPSG